MGGSAVGVGGWLGGDSLTPPFQKGRATGLFCEGPLLYAHRPTHPPHPPIHPRPVAGAGRRDGPPGAGARPRHLLRRAPGLGGPPQGAYAEGGGSDRPPTRSTIDHPRAPTRQITHRTTRSRGWTPSPCPTPRRASSSSPRRTPRRSGLAPPSTRVRGTVLRCLFKCERSPSLTRLNHPSIATRSRPGGGVLPRRGGGGGRHRPGDPGCGLQACV